MKRRNTKPDNVIDGSYFGVMFWMGRDWVVKVYPLGGTIAFHMADDEDRRRLPRVLSVSQLEG
jgi:hypothetical protein